MDCRSKKGLLADSHRDTNVHRGKVKKTVLAAFFLRIARKEPCRIPSKGWAEMIRTKNLFVFCNSKAMIANVDNFMASVG